MSALMRLVILVNGCQQIKIVYCHSVRTFEQINNLDTNNESRGAGSESVAVSRSVCTIYCPSQLGIL